MDLLSELEAYADAAATSNQLELSSPNSSIARWTSIFGYSQSEAENELERQRLDLDRPQILNRNRTLVQHFFPEHDKQSYEHSLFLQREHPLRG